MELLTAEQMSNIDRDPVAEFMVAHPGVRVATVSHADTDVTVYHIAYGDYRGGAAVSDYIAFSSAIGPADVVLRALEHAWARMIEASKVPA